MGDGRGCALHVSRVEWSEAGACFENEDYRPRQCNVAVPQPCAASSLRSMLTDVQALQV